MTNRNNKELTALELMMEIRLICGLNVKGRRRWFNKDEAIGIAKKARPSKATSERKFTNNS